MKSIKNIIFDFGGIFLNIDLNKTAEAFAKLGVSNFDSMYSLAEASALFEKLETGLISPEEFYEDFRNEISMNLSNDEIKNSWNALLLDYPLERLVWLDEIKEKYNIYLFSNTNQIHQNEFIEIFFRQTGKRNFDDYFIKAWYSHKVKMRKPYPKSFTALLQAENLNPAETLFVDDTFKNIEGAIQAGLKTFHLPPPKTVFDLPL